jgi:hypothetical protein
MIVHYFVQIGEPKSIWWSERNGVREGEHRRTAADLAYVVHTNTEEFLEIHKESVGRPHNSQKQWHRPPGEWLKINTDGAFSASTGEGLGLCD